MSNFRLVVIDTSFFEQLKKLSGNNDFLTKSSRRYVGLWDEETSWYIPLRANVSESKPVGAYFLTPFKTDNKHFVRPGLDFEKALFVPALYVHLRKNNLPKEQAVFIFSHVKRIQARFESYVLSVPQFDKNSAAYKFSTVPLFPDGIERIGQIVETRQTGKKVNLTAPVLEADSGLNVTHPSASSAYPVRGQ